MSLTTYDANLTKAVDKTNVLGEMLNSVINSVKSINPTVNNNSKVQIILTDPELRAPIPSELLYINRIPDIIEYMMEKLNGVLQSDASYTGSNSTITVRTFNGSSGGAYKKLLHNDDVLLKKCIVKIKNDDNRCLPRSIIVALGKLNKDPQYASIINPKLKLQTIRTMELIKL